MNKRKFGLVAIILLLGALLAIATLASAANIYASGTTTITSGGKVHYALIYNVPYSTFQSNIIKVGGYKTWLLPLLYPHNDPQQWLRQSYDSGRKSILLIPERYTILRSSYAREIYVYYSSGGGGGGGAG